MAPQRVSVRQDDRVTVTRLPVPDGPLRESDDPYELLGSARDQVEEMTKRLRHAPRDVSALNPATLRGLADALEALDVATQAITTARAAVDVAMLVAMAQKDRAQAEQERADRAVEQTEGQMSPSEPRASVEVHSYP
jgi:hypothetical protein